MDAPPARGGVDENGTNEVTPSAPHRTSGRWKLAIAAIFSLKHSPPRAVANAVAGASVRKRCGVGVARNGGDGVDDNGDDGGGCEGGGEGAGDSAGGRTVGTGGGSAWWGAGRGGMRVELG